LKINRRNRRYLNVLSIEEPINLSSFFSKEPERILLVGMKRLGDFIITIPSIKAIQKHFPRSHLTISTTRSLEELSTIQGHCDEFIPLPSSNDDFLKIAKEYDLIIAFRDWYNIQLPYNGWPLYYMLSTNILLGKPAYAHLHYLAALKNIGIRGRIHKPYIKLPKAIIHQGISTFQKLELNPKKDLIISVHPGSGYEGKCWSSNGFKTVIKYLIDCYNAKILIIEGPDDKHIFNEIKNEIKHKNIVHLRKLTVIEIASLIKQSDFFFGNDSGIMHLADAVNCPSVVIFGPSRPEVWGPTHPKSVLIYKDDVKWLCPYCSKRDIKDQPCRMPNDPKCLTSITIDDVIGGIESLISMLNIRDKYPGTNSFKLSDSYLYLPIEKDKLILSSSKSLNTLVFSGLRDHIDELLNKINDNISYTKFIKKNPHFQLIIDALIAKRLLVPEKYSDTEPNNGNIIKIWDVINHPIFKSLLVSSLEQYSSSNFVSNINTEKTKHPIKRILLVNGILPHIYGGGEKWYIRTGKSLVQRGYEVFCWGTKGHNWIKDAQKEGMYNIELPFPITLNYHELPELVYSLKTYNFDVAIFNLEKDLITAGIPLKISGLTSIYMRKGLPNIKNNPLIRWIFKNLLEGVIVPSIETKSSLVQNHWIEEDKIHHIPNGFYPNTQIMKNPNEMKKLLGLNGKEFIFLTVGRLVKQKGYKYLIDSINKILKKNPDIKLLIIGDGIERKNLSQQIQKFNLSNHIQLLGERWDVYNIMQIADCYVITSLYEGMNNTMLEAMSSGLPVVSTEVNGAKEVIENRKNGYIVPIKNVEKLAETLTQVIKEKGKSSEIAKAGKKKVYNQYTFTQMIDSLECLLKMESIS
jgi:glycosyltransferase involved in cell wall biosynthesis/ADP-heptose:LPS heptosyltransferase